MQFLTSLFGGAENTALTAILALGIVLVLIVLGVWSLKLFFKASSNIGRGRNRRLSVVDSVAIDPKRQLLIVRRDNVEHLLLTGGPQDMVVETGIPVEPAPRGLRPSVPSGGGAGAMPLRTPAEAPAESGDDPEKAAIRSRIERFRELGRPAGARKSASLRHTGLMRSAGREPSVIPMLPEKSEHPHLDSATSSPANDISGQAKRGAGSHYGDAIKADGSQN
jgi:flagellar protein FliO/FliZ